MGLWEWVGWSEHTLIKAGGWGMGWEQVSVCVCVFYRILKKLVIKKILYPK